MTITSKEIHEAEADAIADELRAKEELETLKAKASEVLSSPYVRGGAGVYQILCKRVFV